MPFLLIRFLSCLSLRYAFAQRDGPTHVDDALGFGKKLRGMIADLKALLLLCFLELGLALNFQATTIGVHVVSTSGRFTTSAAAAMA